MFKKNVLKRKWDRILFIIKNKEFSSIVFLFVTLGFRILGFLCALPTVLILWILKPVFWLKVGRLHITRLGHLALNTEVFLRRRQLGSYPDGPFYCFLAGPSNFANHPLCNHQLLDMHKRVIPVSKSIILTAIYTGMLPILKWTPFYQSLDIHWTNNHYHELNNAEPALSFTPDEIEKGRKLLNEMNVDLDKDEYVCIYARDKAYLKALDTKTNWDYHNFRNFEIDSLIETAKYLIDKGFVVIRVGSIAENPINFSHEKLIDYPFSGHQSDFLDIFLVAHCKFVISNGTSGIVNVAPILDKPILTVNAHGNYEAYPGKDALFLWTKYKYSDTNKRFHFKDSLSFELGWWENPADYGLEVELASAEDILEATKEMIARLENRFEYSPESEKLMQAYYKLFSKISGYETNSKIPVGITWLKKNQDLFF